MDKVLIVSPEISGRTSYRQNASHQAGTSTSSETNQTTPPKSGWRNLRSDEVEILVKNDNTADNWDEILVSDQFDPHQIKNSRFYGLVRIGTLRNVIPSAPRPQGSFRYLRTASSSHAI